MVAKIVIVSSICDEDHYDTSVLERSSGTDSELTSSCEKIDLYGSLSLALCWSFLHVYLAADLYFPCLLSSWVRRPWEVLAEHFETMLKGKAVCGTISPVEPQVGSSSTGVIKDGTYFSPCRCLL